MKTTLKPAFFSVAALLLLTFQATDTLAADGVFEERLSLDGPIVLDVSTGSGRIEIRPGSGNEAFIRGEIRVQKKGIFGRNRANKDEIVQAVMDNPPIELRNGKLRVGRFDDRSLGRKVSISYEITVPANSETIASSGSGSISVIDIAAPVEASAGSGSIELGNIGGAVEASTGSGSIRADGVAGAFEGSTGSGRITMSQTAPGDVRVSTGSGGSELTGVVGAVRASAGSGRITVEGRMTGDWDLHTGSGGIRVALPADAAFDIDAESNSGGLDIEHPVTVQGRISKRRITGEVRGGGPLLKIDTGSGGVSVL
jgi:hypothetical protein